MQKPQKKQNPFFDLRKLSQPDYKKKKKEKCIYLNFKIRLYNQDKER